MSTKKKATKNVVKKKSKLTPKQECFAAEYLVDLNASQAAIRAGYSANGARVTASKLLTNPNIQEIIQSGADRRSQRTEVSQDRVITELARIAFLDIRNAFTEDGNLIPIHEMPEDVARAIGGMDLTSYSDGDDGEVLTKKIKLIDKKGALELLGKHLKIFTDKVEHSGNIQYTEMSEDELNRKIQHLESLKDQGLRD